MPTRKAPWPPSPNGGTTGPPHSKSLLDGTVHTTMRTITCPTGQHKNGWIMGATACPCPDNTISPLLLVPPKTFHLSQHQNLAHTEVLTRACILHLGLACQPPGRGCLWGLRSRKHKISTLEIVSCILRPQTKPLGEEAIWPLSSTLPSPLPPPWSQRCASCSPKLIQGVRSGTQSTDLEDLSSCHPRPRDLPDKVPADGRTSVCCSRLRVRVWEVF